MVQLMKKMYGWIDRTGERLSHKEVQIPVNLTVGIVFLLFSGFLWLTMPQQVTVAEKDVVNGRAFPTLLITLMLLCCVVLIAREIFNMVTGRPVERKTLNLLTEAKALVIFLILLVTYLLSKATDLFAVGGIFCALAFMVYFRCKKPLYYGITIGAAVVVWAAFRFLLGVNF